MMKEYKFYGWQTADVSAVNEGYKEIKDPRHLYDLLSEIWCADTCSPRMRDGWSKENMTLGQCSITAFLAQDIFGGEVYGMLLYHGSYMVMDTPDLAKCAARKDFGKSDLYRYLNTMKRMAYQRNSGLSVKDFIPSDLAKKALKLDTQKALRMEEMRPFVMV